MQGLEYIEHKPSKKLSAFVESYWMLVNTSGQDKPVVLLPDGRIDAIFGQNRRSSFTLHGLESHASCAEIPAGAHMYAISFSPLAIGYLFKGQCSLLPDTVQQLPSFLNTDAIADFGSFCAEAENVLTGLIPESTDMRKQKLFQLLYTTNGSITISELSDDIGWSSRQMNRYFKDITGMPIKAYASILRFRASFGHIKNGKLFPEEDFADQSHFIREVKKFSGVVPKELALNKNDRFIQFSVLRHK